MCKVSDRGQGIYIAYRVPIKVELGQLCKRSQGRDVTYVVAPKVKVLQVVSEGTVVIVDEPWQSGKIR